MNLFARYFAYLRDNPHHYWFKRKLYGWGWIPVTWEGWLSLFVFILIFLWVYVPFLSAAKVTSPSIGAIIWFAVRTVFIFGALFVLCYYKGERPHWQWGINNKMK